MTRTFPLRLSGGMLGLALLLTGGGVHAQIGDLDAPEPAQPAAAANPIPEFLRDTGRPLPPIPSGFKVVTITVPIESWLDLEVGCIVRVHDYRKDVDITDSDAEGQAISRLKASSTDVTLAPRATIYAMTPFAPSAGEHVPVCVLLTPDETRQVLRHLRNGGEFSLTFVEKPPFPTLSMEQYVPRSPIGLEGPPHTPVAPTTIPAPAPLDSATLRVTDAATDPAAATAPARAAPATDNPFASSRQRDATPSEPAQPGGGLTIRPGPADGAGATIYVTWGGTTTIEMKVGSTKLIEMPRLETAEEFDPGVIEVTAAHGNRVKIKAIGEGSTTLILRPRLPGQSPSRVNVSVIGGDEQRSQVRPRQGRTTAEVPRTGPAAPTDDSPLVPTAEPEPARAAPATDNPFASSRQRDATPSEPAQPTSEVVIRPGPADGAGAAIYLPGGTTEIEMKMGSTRLIEMPQLEAVEEFDPGVIEVTAARGNRVQIKAIGEGSTTLVLRSPVVRPSRVNVSVIGGDEGLIPALPEQRRNAADVSDTAAAEPGGVVIRPSRPDAAGVTVDLTPGDSHVFEMKMGTTNQIKIGNLEAVEDFDPGVIEVTAARGNRVKIKAIGEGSTTLVLRSRGGAPSRVDVRVIGSEDEQRSQAELAETIRILFPTARVNIVQVRDSIVLQGTVADVNELARISQIAEQFAPRVLNFLQLEAPAPQSAPVIPAGHRVMTLKIDPRIRSFDVLKPGDCVDILVHIPTVNGVGGRLQTLITNARIFAAEPPFSQRIRLSLILPAEFVESLKLAESVGTLLYNVSLDQPGESAAATLNEDVYSQLLAARDRALGHVLPGITTPEPPTSSEPDAAPEPVRNYDFYVGERESGRPQPPADEALTEQKRYVSPYDPDTETILELLLNPTSGSTQPLSAGDRIDVIVVYAVGMVAAPYSNAELLLKGAKVTDLHRTHGDTIHASLVVPLAATEIIQAAKSFCIFQYDTTAAFRAEGQPQSGLIRETADFLEPYIRYIAAAQSRMRDETLQDDIRALHADVRRLIDILQQRQGEAQPTDKGAAEPASELDVVPVPEADLPAASADAGDVRVLFFAADWCGPCQKMLPIVRKLAAEGLNVTIVDVDHDRELTGLHRVKSIPAFVFHRGETEVARLTGMVLEATLRQAIIAAGSASAAEAAVTSPATGRVVW